MIIAVCSGFYIKPSVDQFPLWYRVIKPSIDSINEHCADAPIYLTTPINSYVNYDIQGYVQGKNDTPIQ
jgi:hypothetical protein